MEYSKIIAVTGLPGLQELISTKTDGAIVRSLEDNSTKFVSSRVHNFSHLESIEIYTVRENVNLVDIFQAMGNSKEALPDEKDAKAVKTYFEKVYPDIDFERVYNSDMKKIVKWFSVLQSKDVEIKLSEPIEEEEEETAPEPVAAPAKKTTKPAPAEKEEATKKKATAKKAEPAKEVKKEKAETPQKKAAATKSKKETEKKAEPAKKKAGPKKK